MKYFQIEEGSSLKITLNRPETGNAFHHEMILEMTDLFKKINADPKYKMIFLAGSGKHFCTGADLNWMSSAETISPEENVHQMEDLMKMYKSIATCPLPLITYVHGAAYGGGIGLCSLSDYVIADRDSLFCLSEMKYGLLPGALTPFLLTKIGKTQFMKLALEANPFDSDKALSLGLITEIGDKKHAQDCLKKFEAWPAISLKNLKKSVQLFSDDITEGFEKLKYLSAECRSDKEVLELTKTFRKK